VSLPPHRVPGAQLPALPHTPTPVPPRVQGVKPNKKVVSLFKVILKIYPILNVRAFVVSVAGWDSWPAELPPARLLAGGQALPACCSRQGRGLRHHVARRRHHRRLHRGASPLGSDPHLGSIAGLTRHPHAFRRNATPGRVYSRQTAMWPTCSGTRSTLRQRWRRAWWI
jgi:hypothetical protein